MVVARVASDNDLALWLYLDKLHSWSMQHFEALWARIDLDRIDASYRRVFQSFVDLHYRSTAAALFAVDDYVLFQSTMPGWWTEPDWRDADRWWRRPYYLRNGDQLAADALARVPYAMKWMIGNGQGPKAADDVGRARVARVLGTDPAAAARNYSSEFVSEVGGPEVRSDLSRSQAARRAARIGGPGGQIPVPDDLSLPRVGSSEGVFQQWRRVPRPGACDFCIMLATRGAVYSSRKASLFRYDGRRYHDLCRCRSQLVTVKWLSSEVVISPGDARRVVRYKASSGTTYEYDLSQFNVVPPLPQWL